jgi:hypothetical protein
MKKAGFILMVGLLLSVTAFACLFYLGTASSRGLMNEPQPGLAWLKKEFKLSDAEFARVTKLHEAYMPQCAERCRRIAQLSGKLGQLLNNASVITPEIQNVLAERAKMRADCEAEMLSHFLEVSRMMPPEQGQRYLQWVEQECVLTGQAMEQSHRSPSTRQSKPTADHQM